MDSRTKTRVGRATSLLKAATCSRKEGVAATTAEAGAAAAHHRFIADGVDRHLPNADAAVRR